MSTIHELALTLQAIDSMEPSQAAPSSLCKVTGAKASHATVNGKRTQGYLLTRDGDGLPVAFIEVIAYDSRISTSLERLTRVPTMARHVVRGLLNAEDYTSTMYDGIKRVYYAGEFSL